MTSLWKAAASASLEAAAVPPTRPSVPGLPREPVDVLVVGAGITGLSAALMLLRAGRSVIVIPGLTRDPLAFATVEEKADPGSRPG